MSDIVKVVSDAIALSSAWERRNAVAVAIVAINACKRFDEVLGVDRGYRQQALHMASDFLAKTREGPLSPDDLIMWTDRIYGYLVDGPAKGAE